jgi:hypothetical protein
MKIKIRLQNCFSKLQLFAIISLSLFMQNLKNHKKTKKILATVWLQTLKQKIKEVEPSAEIILLKNIQTGIFWYYPTKISLPPK